MGFIGSTAYYVLCASTLVILIILLIALQVKPKQKPRKTEPRHQQADADYVPKYAAGDDMDQINRNAYALWSEKKFHYKELPIIFIGILVLIGVFMSELHQAEPVTPPTPTPPSPVQPTIPVTVPAPTGQLQAELNSADFNNDLSKIFVTYTYTNDTNASFYSIITTIDLEDENNVVIQSKTADTVESVKANESKEITVSVSINPENIGKVKRVTIHTTYQRH